MRITMWNKNTKKGEKREKTMTKYTEKQTKKNPTK